MAQGAHKITEEFEKRLCDYTGSPYAVAIDNCSNALFLCLKFLNVGTVKLPAHTYPSVPCEVIHAGGKVEFYSSPEYLTGMYRLEPYPIWDCSLEFTCDMYIPGNLMCLSFTGPYKQLKLGKGGAILTDNEQAYKWFKKARFSGRNECSYLEDRFTSLGWNFYMMPEIAAKGIQLMDQFYPDGQKKGNPPLSHKYPNLKEWPIYQ